MLFLWVFGDNIEDAVGHMKFLAFYLRLRRSWRPVLLFLFAGPRRRLADRRLGRRGRR